MTATATAGALYDPALDLRPDPLADVQVDDEIDRDDRQLWHYLDGAACSADIDDRYDPDSVGYGQCSRLAHPPHWRHIAASGPVVCGVWGGDPDWTPPGEGVELEPAEETPLVVGQLVNSRNGTDVMLIVGLRKAYPDRAAEQDVEVLDLTHQRFRALRREQLVSRPADAAPITAAQTRWVAEHVAKARADVRAIAMRELRAGRFDEPTLNSVLDELGLERYVRRYRGHGTVYFEYEVPQEATNDSAGASRVIQVPAQVAAAVRAAMADVGDAGVRVTDVDTSTPQLS